MGTGLPGMTIVLDAAGEEELGRSGAGGGFEVEVPSLAGSLRLQDPDYVTLGAATLRPGRADGYTLIGAHPVLVSGVVSTESEEPLQGARARVRFPAAALAGLNVPLDRILLQEPSADTDASGRFEFEGVPWVAGMELAIERTGYESLIVNVPAGGLADARLVMKRAPEAVFHLLGRVVYEDGTPAEGARVRWDNVETETDASGGFSLPVEAVHPSAPLGIAKPGCQPAILRDLPRAQDVGSDVWVPTVTLLRPGLSIRGRVVGETGKPREGWLVQLGDPTILTPNTVPMVTLEELCVEPDAANELTPADGGFSLEGLSDRAYTLVARNPSLGGYEARVGPVPAGSEGVEIRVAEGSLGTLTGRVVGPEGAPLADVEVSFWLLEAQAEGAITRSLGARTVTGERGTFTLHDVNASSGELSVGGDLVMQAFFRLSDLSTDDLVLHAVRKGHYRVELTGYRPKGPVGIRMFAPDGAQERLLVEEAFRSSSLEVLMLRDGMSPVISAAEGPHTVVLYESGTEVGRKDVSITSEEVQLVEF